MQEHSAIGERILGHVDEYWKSRPSCASITNVSMVTLPGRTRGETIPLVSRIISAVADAYNAMTSDRPYRDAMPSRVA